VSRERTGEAVVGYVLSAMGLAFALLGIFLESVPGEIPGVALGAVGYGLATRSGDRAGQVLGVATVVLCALSMAISSFDLPGVFLES
jgi:hypothetical protein